MPVDKKDRRERAIKKAKLRRGIIIGAVGIAVLAVAAFIVIAITMSVGTEAYTDGQQNLILRTDGSYTAVLFHGNSFNGTYVRTADGLELTYGSGGSTMTAHALIEGDMLHLPTEWDDNHGHGKILIKR